MKEKNSPQPGVSLQQKIALVVLGLCLSLVLLETGMRLGGFVLSSIQEYGNLQSIKQKGAYRILCLGESTTQGQYPQRLEQILNQRNAGVRFSVIDKGLYATNSSAILSRVGPYLDEYHPDMVIAMMGINDWGKHMPLEVPTTSKGTLFIRSFRVYKLMRLLELHLLKKAGEMGFYKPDEARRSSWKAQTPVPKTGPRESSAKAISAGGSFQNTAFIKTQEMRSYKPEVDERNPGKAQIPLPGTGSKETSAEAVSIEEPSRKATGPSSPNDKVFVDVGKAQRDQSPYPQDENSLKRAVERDPKNYEAYRALGGFYQDQGKLPQAEASLRKVVELDPKSAPAYVHLGTLFQLQGKFSQAETSFKKAIELNPEQSEAYRGLAELYEGGHTGKAEVMFKKAIEVDPKNFEACLDLGWLYRRQKRFLEAEEFFKKAMERSRLQNDDDGYSRGRTLRTMASLYEEMGKPGLAKEYVQKIAGPGLECYPVTLHNYRKLKETLDQKGIKLVCMQYPMRKVETLKRIFGRNEGVIFVDNESLFAEAVKKGSYKEYFKDMFAGDFGHCTQKGNELLAQNIAAVILKEVFNQ
jgi:tetratricopeptide (TPR) repeat protein